MVIVGIVISNRLLICLPVALVVSIGYGLWCGRVVPRYSSSATLQFEKPRKLVTVQGVVDPGVHPAAEVNDYIQIFRSEELQNKAILSFSADEKNILLRAAIKRLP